MGFQTVEVRQRFKPISLGFQTVEVRQLKYLFFVVPADLQLKSSVLLQNERIMFFPYVPSTNELIKEANNAQLRKILGWH